MIDLVELLKEVRKERAECEDVFRNHPESWTYNQNKINHYLVTFTEPKLFPDEVYAFGSTYGQNRDDLECKVFTDIFELAQKNLSERSARLVGQMIPKWSSYSHLLGLRELSEVQVDELGRMIEELPQTKYVAERTLLFESALKTYDVWIKYLECQSKPAPSD